MHRNDGSMFPAKRVALFILGAAVVAQGQATKASIASIQSLIRAQEYDQALQLTRSALHETPNDFRLWTLEGIVLSIKGSNHDALSAFDRALSLSPNYTEAPISIRLARDAQRLPSLDIGRDCTFDQGQQP